MWSLLRPSLVTVLGVFWIAHHFGIADFVTATALYNRVSLIATERIMQAAWSETEAVINGLRAILRQIGPDEDYSLSFHLQIISARILALQRTPKRDKSKE